MPRRAASASSEIARLKARVKELEAERGEQGAWVSAVNTLQNAMKAEVQYIEGRKSYMNLPPHLVQRLSELQTQLAK